MRANPHTLVAALVVAVGMAACDGGTSTPASTDQGCAGCHGDPARAGSRTDQAAPPLDAHGQSATTLVSVGAHQAHLSNGVACATCHVVPAANDMTHINGQYATVTFSGNVVGANNTVVAPWTHDVATCANYCHGPNLGGSVPSPLWTRSAPLDCGACHYDQRTALTTTGLHDYHVNTLPPAAGVTCGSCHGPGYATTSVSGAAIATHANGQVQTLLAVGWQDPTCNGPRTCYASCHTVQGCRLWP
jgi:predicted CxxxxCH...CXXCH cytochrome family protein